MMSSYRANHCGCLFGVQPMTAPVVFVCLLVSIELIELLLIWILFYCV